MPPVNFHQLSIFHTVARVGSFTKAAAELDISQPAVSIQVKQLERSLQTTLLSRLRRGVVLTDTGEAVYGYTKRIFSLADEMRYAIQDILSSSAYSTPAIRWSKFPSPYRIRRLWWTRY